MPVPPVETGGLRRGSVPRAVAAAMLALGGGRAPRAVPAAHPRRQLRLLPARPVCARLPEVRVRADREVRGWSAVLASARADADTGGSAAVAVLEDVDRGLVALLDGGAVGVHDGGDARHGGDTDAGTGTEGQQDGQEGLHEAASFPEGRRRSATVDADTVIHNAAPVASPSAAP